MKYILLCLLGCTYFGAFAQDGTWKEHEKIADEMMAKGQYAQAADNYEMAWEQKPSKKSLLANAADAYRLRRNYRKAADCYKSLLDDSDFPLARLHYGRCLKQDGQYQAARNSLQTFLDTYNGPDQAALSVLVREDLRGCGLAQEWSKKKVPNTLSFLSGINTAKDEFAPLPFADDILYFSSTQKDHARIFRTQRKQGQFTNAVEPDLPRTPGGHFCHGSFTPNNERFYFTVCQGDEAWKGISSKCELYVTMREQNSWSVPQKMRDYVKMDGTTVTQPFVIHQGDTEILYFSSDRSGGQGGMDIWFMTRQIVGKDIDFTYPTNAGKVINSAGDEVSPFYDIAKGKLYFASNGWANIGGFDIFEATGSQQDWEAPQNMGLPINSSADDYYYSPSGNGAFLASNRSFGAEKLNTTDDDLFYWGEQQSIASGMVSGVVYDKTSGKPLEEVEVAIYEKVDTGLKRLLKSQVFSDGSYQFPILPERDFLIEGTKAGYADASFEFNTFHYDGTDPGRPIYLEKRNVSSPSSVNSSSPVLASRGVDSSSQTSVNPPVEDQPKVSVSTIKTENVSSPTPTPVIQTSTSSKDSYTNSRYKTDGVTTNAPRHSGTYFKVQLAVVIDYDLQADLFLKMQQWGRLDSEYIIEKGWTRVLLADFFDLEQARQIMDKAHLMGFPEAFIVRYVDGYRKN